MTFSPESIIGIIALLLTASGFFLYCGRLSGKADSNAKEIEDGVHVAESNKQEHVVALKETRAELKELINEKLASTEKLTIMMDKVKEDLQGYVQEQIKSSEQIVANQSVTRELAGKVGNLEGRVSDILTEQAVQGHSIIQLVELIGNRVKREDARDEMLREALAGRK